MEKVRDIDETNTHNLNLGHMSVRYLRTVYLRCRFIIATMHAYNVHAVHDRNDSWLQYKKTLIFILAPLMKIK